MRLLGLAFAVLVAGAQPASSRLLTGFEGELPGVLEGSAGGPELADCTMKDLFAPADRPPAAQLTKAVAGLPVREGSSMLLLSTSPLDGSPDDLRQTRWRLVFELTERSSLSLDFAFRSFDAPGRGDWFLISLDDRVIACSAAIGSEPEDRTTGWVTLGGGGSLVLEPGRHVLEAAVGDGLDAEGRSDLLLDALRLEPQPATAPAPPTPCRPHPAEDVGEIATGCLLPPITDCDQGVECPSPRRVWTFDDNRFCPNGAFGQDADGDGFTDCLPCRRPEDAGDPNPPGSCFECTDATDLFFEMYVVADCGTEMHLPLNDVESGCISIFDQDRNPIDIEVDNGFDFFETGGEVCWMAEDCDGGGMNDPGGPGDSRVMDVRFTAEPSLCGVFIARFRSWAGCIWDLFANCDGTNREQFIIFDDFCEAEASYDPRPELIVANLQTTPREGCRVDYCVDVRNIGCELASPHAVRVANEVDSAFHAIDTLEPGEVVRVCGTLDVVDDGADPQLTRVTAWSDWFDELLECTEDPTASSCNAANGGDVISRLQPINCNSAPTCDAGGPYSAECTGAEGGTFVPLDGSGSSDPEDQPLSHLWTTDCPGASFDDPTSPTPVLLIPGLACDLSCEVQLRVSDPDGLEATCVEPVTVSDSTPPSLICPPEVEGECSDPDVPTRQEWLAMASATDACDGEARVERAILFQNSPCPGSSREVWRFTAVDACGNEGPSCESTWSVMDTQPPVLVLPEDRLVECPEDPEADVAAWAAGASAVDDCSGPLLVGRELLSVEPGCSGTETRTYRFTATDLCGNMAEGIRIWQSVDTTPPVLRNVPPDLSVPCDGVPAPAPVRADDDCDPFADVELVETREPGSCPDRFVLVRTWTGVDSCGNSAVAVQRITVSDDDPPNLEGVPPDAAFDCGEVPSPPVVVAADDCDPDPVVLFQEVRTDGDCPDEYSLTRTWTATDRCGNEASASQVISVTDLVAPSLLGVPADEAADCSDVPPPAAVSATDDCDPSPSLVFSELRTDGTCPDEYRLTRTWTATDRCGNEASASQVISVTDLDPPSLLGVPADETVECDEVPAPAAVSATDDCDPSPSVSFSELRTDGDCPFRYTLTRTWTATDRCGNEASQSQELTVVDTSPPVLAAPDDLVVECPAPSAGPSSESAWLAQASATDTCGTPVVHSVELSRTPGCGLTYVALFELWAVDECGNESPRVLRSYSVVDTTPPVSAPPDDVVVECPAPESGPGSAAAWRELASASDSCGEAQTRSELLERRPGCGNTYTDIWEFWAVDECGNESARQARSYEVVDTTPPVFEAGEPLFDESLWPPQHGYVVFGTDDMASATDACGEVVIAVTGCSSSQPEEVHQGRTEDGGNGDGRTFEDCVWAVDGTEFAARAERLGACGTGSARIYAVELTATDECGNSASAQGLLRVEHDRRGGQPVRRGRKLGPKDPPPFPYVHETTYGEGCGEAPDGR